MKKVLYLATMLLCMAITSCQKEDIGGTATESLAGQWYVLANMVNDDGSVIEDPYGLGRFQILTYNTAANNPNEIWIDDSKNFWNFKVKATGDINNLTFSAASAQNQRGDEITVNITNGKIIKNGGVQNNGSPADYITMDVEFSDNPGTIYRLEGVRYSGLEEND
jgi:hypothetical protein